MGAVGRILLIIVVIVVVAAGAGYFLLPNAASRTETITVERPAPAVFARLASTPAGAALGQGVTLTEITSAENNTVVGNVAYADGATGRVTYTVAPDGEGSSVQVRLEQDLGANPVARFTAIGGGPVSPLIEGAAAAVTADLNVLPNTNFEGLQYSVVQVEERPFFYIQNCSPTDAEAVKSVITDSLLALRPIMARHNLTIAGPPIAYEPRVENNEYCYRIGYPYTGTPPRVLAVGSAGTIPGGTQLRMVYTGTEEQVWEQIYNPMDALLAAAHLDDPGTNADDWANYEVYNDDPTQAGGSRNREIYYVAPGDITALTRIVPPSANVQAPAATATPETPSAATPPASAPTPAPAPAQ
jgi:hypothetical protein